MSGLGILRSMIDSRWSVGGLLVVALALGAGTAAADPNDDLYNRKSDWDKIKGRTAEASRNVDSYLEKSRKLRAMDKSELDALIAQICRLDIARNDDEADRLAKKITDDVVKNVNNEYDNINSEADRLEDDVERLMNDAKSLRDYTSTLRSRTTQRIF